MQNNYFIRHYGSTNSGYGKFVEGHYMWLMCGNKEPGSIDEYDRKGGTFRYCHVANPGEYILFNKSCHKLVPGADRPAHLNDYETFKSLMIDICSFLNSRETLKTKSSKGKFYISEFCFDEDYSGGKTYALNLVRSDESRKNESREDHGGFINNSTGDIHLFEMYCFGYKMRNSRKKIMQQICNALNQGVINF